MKREFLAGLVIVSSMAAAIFSWAQGPPEETPTPARNAFVRVFAPAPFAFNGAFVAALDAETTTTAAQKYAVLKTLVLAEAAVSARNVGQLFTDAPPAVKVRLKATTKTLLDQATSDTLAQAALLQAEAQSALENN